MRGTQPRALGGGLTDGMASAATVCVRGARRDSARAEWIGVRIGGAGPGRRR